MKLLVRYGIRTPFTHSVCSLTLLFTSNAQPRSAQQARWNINFIGVTGEEAANQSERSKEMAKYNQAVAEINDEENLVFEGEQGRWFDGYQTLTFT